MLHVFARSFKPPSRPETLAVVDLGSNSFRLEIGRVEGDQIFRLDTWRETIRFGAGIDARRQPDARRAQGGARLPRALPASGCRDCIRPPCARSRPTRSASRATRRRSCRRPRPRSAFPIDIIGGHEEARLIYLGVAHVLPRVGRAAPRHRHRRRVDRVHHRPRPDAASASSRSSSAASACRSASSRTASCAPTRFAPRRRMRARTSRRSRASSAPDHWREAFASSGTALALAAILEENGLSVRRHHARRARAPAQAHDRRRPRLAARRSWASSPSARPCSPADSRSWRPRCRSSACSGSIRSAARCASACSTICSAARSSATAAQVTVESISERYHVDRAHAKRVAAMAKALYLAASPHPDRRERAAPRVGGAAARDRLLGVAHRLSQARRVHPRERRHARLLRAGAAPPRAARDWAAAAACRRWTPLLADDDFAAQVLALRLAVLFHHARRAIDMPRITLAVGRQIRFATSKRWLKAHPLTERLLEVERDEWAALGGLAEDLETRQASAALRRNRGSARP